MEKAEFISILDKIGAKDDRWLPLERISEIRMKDGSAYYPNVKRIRFRLDRKGNALLVLYGSCERYGAALRNVGFSYDMRKIRVSMGPKDFVAQEYPIPKAGDILRVTASGSEKASVPITSVSAGMNMMILELNDAITLSDAELGISRFSYYSPELEKPMNTRSIGYDCLYLNFVQNGIRKSLFRKDFHRIIKSADVDFISVA